MRRTSSTSPDTQSDQDRTDGLRQMVREDIAEQRQTVERLLRKLDPRIPPKLN